MDVVNSISCVLDCKVDIREKKYEFPLRSWSNYYVTVEAIKCFPCYIKISLYRDCSDTDTNLIVRINIPGVQVLPAQSRTKQFAYGLFWKNNRKKCCAFFGFDSQFSCDNHMNWMQTQIKNLEDYRQEILESRRASRFKLEQSGMNTTCDESVIYKNLDLDDTKNIRDVNDILGPLPKIPESSAVHLDTWSRRVSGLSQIYEEIVEPPPRKNFNPPRDSVASIASGIYEEMRLPRVDVDLSKISSTPPPLPPRTRINTDCCLKRSYTTPESDYFTKKKSWYTFGGVFSRSRKRDKSRKFQQAEIAKNKRNSFSSPDLSHLYCGEDVEVTDTGSGDLNCSFDVCNRTASNSSESSTYALERLYENDEFVIPEFVEEKEKSCKKDVVIYEVPRSLNISHDITNNFDMTMASDISRINLVGNCCKVEEKKIYDTTAQVDARISPTPRYDKAPPGYLEMTAGKGFNRQKVEELDRKNQLELDLSNEYLKIQYTFHSPINFKRGAEVPDSVYENMKKPDSDPIYINMESPRRLSDSEGNEFVFNNEFAQKCEEKSKTRPNKNSLNVNMRKSSDRKVPEVVFTPDYDKSSLDFLEATLEEQRKISTSSNSSSLMSSSLKTHQNTSLEAKVKRNSVDDKIASYLPNFDVKPKKPTKKHVRSSTADGAILRKSATPEPTPKKTAKKSIKKDNQENYHSDDPAENNNNNRKDPEVNKKYATLARLNSPNTKSALNESQKSTTTGAITRKFMDLTSPTNMKRFGSLPRFKKLDFSPLRMKINSVLQRHNSEGVQKEKESTKKKSNLLKSCFCL